MLAIGAAAAVLTPLAAFAAYHLTTPGHGSARMKLALLYLKFREQPATAANLDAYLDGLETRRYPRPATPSRELRERYAISQLNVAGRPVFKLEPRSGKSGAAIVYLHGGGFVHALGPTHWGIADALAEATGATVYVPAYPLAPEHDHRAAWPFLRAVHDRVLEDARPDQVTLVGDSAGGGLALGHALRLRDAGAHLPARLILFSPWVDLALRDPAIAAADAADPMLSLAPLRATGRWWAGPDDAASPKLSPLYADLAGLPPVHIFQGDRDLFVVTSRQLSAKLLTAGVPTEYVEYPGAFHVHVTARFTPEARDTMRKIGAAVRP